MNLANCVECGQLFAKTTHPICLDCMQTIEDDFEKVSVYIRENNAPSVDNVVRDTHVSESRVLSFLRSGRLMTSETLSYPCNSCGEMIQTGTLCAKCRVRNQIIFDKVSQGLKQNGKASSESYHSKSRNTNQ